MAGTGDTAVSLDPVEAGGACANTGKTTKMAMSAFISSRFLST